MEEKRSVSFIQACNEFFGRKEGQGLKEFSEEVKKLTEKDRAELKEGLEKALDVVIKS